MTPTMRAEVETAGFAYAMRVLGREVLPEVVAETLNETADAVTKRSLRYLNQRLTVRTKYTTNSLKRAGAKPYYALNKARGRSVDRMYSRAGSISPYLGIQDSGGEITAPNSRIPIPTLAARTGKRYEKSIAGRYNLGRMGDLARDGRFFLGTPKGDQGPLGIYERYAGNKKIRMLRNLESDKVTVPASRWHSDAADELGSRRMIQARFRRNADRRLKRMARRTAG